MRVFPAAGAVLGGMANSYCLHDGLLRSGERQLPGHRTATPSGRADSLPLVEAGSTPNQTISLRSSSAPSTSQVLPRLARFRTEGFVFTGAMDTRDAPDQAWDPSKSVFR